MTQTDNGNLARLLRSIADDGYIDSLDRADLRYWADKLTQDNDH